MFKSNCWECLLHFPSYYSSEKYPKWTIQGIDNKRIEKWVTEYVDGTLSNEKKEILDKFGYESNQ